jgi:hypothetical protein
MRCAAPRRRGGASARGLVEDEAGNVKAESAAVLGWARLELGDAPDPPPAEPAPRSSEAGSSSSAKPFTRSGAGKRKLPNSSSTKRLNASRPCFCGTSSAVGGAQGSRASSVKTRQRHDVACSPSSRGARRSGWLPSFVECDVRSGRREFHGPRRGRGGPDSHSENTR